MWAYRHADYIPLLEFSAFQTTIGSEIAITGSALMELEGLGLFPLYYSFAVKMTQKVVGESVDTFELVALAIDPNGDDDNDGIPDTADAFPRNPDELDPTDCPEALCPPPSSILKLIIQILNKEI